MSSKYKTAPKTTVMSVEDFSQIARLLIDNALEYDMTYPPDNLAKKDIEKYVRLGNLCKYLQKLNPQMREQILKINHKLDPHTLTDLQQNLNHIGNKELSKLETIALLNKKPEQNNIIRIIPKKDHSQTDHKLENETELTYYADMDIQELTPNLDNESKNEINPKNETTMTKKNLKNASENKNSDAKNLTPEEEKIYQMMDELNIQSDQMDLDEDLFDDEIIYDETCSDEDIDEINDFFEKNHDELEKMTTEEKREKLKAYFNKRHSPSPQLEDSLNTFKNAQNEYSVYMNKTPEEIAADSQCSEDSLCGKCLINLSEDPKDPNYHAVIYIHRCNKKEVRGLQLNKKMFVKAEIEKRGKEGGYSFPLPPKYTELNLGGMFSPAFCHILYPAGEYQNKDPNKVIQNGIELSCSIDLFEEIFEDRGPKTKLVAMGYQCWSYDEFEWMLASGQWELATPSMEMIFHTEDDKKWEKIVSENGFTGKTFPAQNIVIDYHNN